MRLALFFALFAFALPAFAAENYIMLADFPIKKVVVRDDEILAAASVFTLDNEKRQTILTPKVENGETLLFLLLADGELKVDVTIKDGVMSLDKKRGLKLFELDLPEVDEE